ncbi:MAG: TRAM domain-containing protein, partial [Candidatus Omnitrophica bacterium]|nr:TRAM domain-containing protein [Candidatus Omnitrophota bacterium]
KLEKLVGKNEESLGIRRAKRKPQSSYESKAYYVKGRTRRGHQVVFKGDKGLIGKAVSVKIKDVESNTLVGELA